MLESRRFCYGIGWTQLDSAAQAQKVTATQSYLSTAGTERKNPQRVLL